MKERDLTPELARIASLLDEVGREQRETLSEAETLESAPGLDRVQLLREEPLTEADGVPRRTLLWLATIVTLAASLVLVLRMLPSDDADGAGDKPSTEYLSGEGFVLVPPDRADGHDALEWTFGAAQGIVFEVRVIDPSDERVLLRERVREPRLPLDTERPLPWPSTVLVEIDALDAGGRLVDSLQELYSFSR